MFLDFFGETTNRNRMKTCIYIIYIYVFLLFCSYGSKLCETCQQFFDQDPLVL